MFLVKAINLYRPLGFKWWVVHFLHTFMTLVILFHLTFMSYGTAISSVSLNYKNKHEISLFHTFGGYDE